MEILGHWLHKDGILMIQNYEINLTCLQGPQYVSGPRSEITREAKKVASRGTKTVKEIYVRTTGCCENILTASMLSDQAAQLVIFVRRCSGHKESTSARK